jgi:hypothetical protein
LLFAFSTPSCLLTFQGFARNFLSVIKLPGHRLASSKARTTLFATVPWSGHKIAMTYGFETPYGYRLSNAV